MGLLPPENWRLRRYIPQRAKDQHHPCGRTGPCDRAPDQLANALRGPVAATAPGPSRQDAAMHFYEFEVKRLLQRHGVAVPKGRTAKTAEEAEGIAAELGGEVAVKSQAFERGRKGKGGVKFVSSPPEAKTAATALLG